LPPPRAVEREGRSAKNSVRDSGIGMVPGTDIGLPGLDGYEVARRLRRLADGGSLRVIAVTGYGTEDDKAQTRAAGIDELVVKPVSLETIDRLLEDLD
jgi:CheY-like chemotaxis protein